MHVQQTERSRQCALSPSHKLDDSGCQHRTVSVVWTAQTSRAQDSAAYIFRDVYRFEIPPNCNIILALETLISRDLFTLFCALYQKSPNLLHATKNYISKHKFLSKKNLVLFSILPSCRVIFPHPPRNSVMLTLPAEFVLCINN